MDDVSDGWRSWPGRLRASAAYPSPARWLRTTRLSMVVGPAARRTRRVLMATIAALLVFTSLSTALPMTAWAEDFYVRITAPKSHDGSTLLYVTFDFFVMEGGAEVPYPVRGFAAGDITKNGRLKAAELEALDGRDGDSRFRAFLRPDETDPINFQIQANAVKPFDDSGSPLLTDACFSDFNSADVG